MTTGRPPAGANPRGARGRQVPGPTCAAGTGAGTAPAARSRSARLDGRAEAPAPRPQEAQDTNAGRADGWRIAAPPSPSRPGRGGFGRGGLSVGMNSLEGMADFVRVRDSETVLTMVFPPFEAREGLGGTGGPVPHDPVRACRVVETLSTVEGVLTQEPDRRMPDVPMPSERADLDLVAVGCWGNVVHVIDPGLASDAPSRGAVRVRLPGSPPGARRSQDGRDLVRTLTRRQRRAADSRPMRTTAPALSVHRLTTPGAEAAVGVCLWRAGTPSSHL